jgi:hypothetical protein
MQLIDSWPILAATVPPIVMLQWWVTRRIHHKELTATRAKHLAAKQSAATLLQQAREQSIQAQKELSAARQAASKAGRAPEPARVASASARAALIKTLDKESERKRALPRDGFADTLPSRQFTPTTSFGLLQPSTHA